jgi:hypothetical protein
VAGAAVVEVMIGTRNGQMPAYLATPSCAGPWPGVVVLHDFAGMSYNLRNQAEWLASEGYLAATPDLYYWGSRLRCLWTIMREVTAGKGRTVADIDAVRDWLPARGDCTGRIGVIGFCLGGGYALALATGHGYAAASPCYHEPSAVGWRPDRRGHHQGWGTSGRSMIRSQEPSGWRRSTCTRIPVLSAERVEVSARFSNLTVGSGVSTANFTPASAICW